MGQLAFAAVGAVVTTAIGVGPAIGWAVGSAIGGVVFAPDGPQTTGPRLDDLKSNVSTYGQPIPRVYGQIGFMGSLIDMEDMKEYENVEEQGKGGDPATSTTFSYSSSFAMIICRGEVSTIPDSVAVKTLLRIWINEKCYYDIRDDSNIEAINASQQFARFFKFYPGNQTQMPDPTLEAMHGVGNVPAYRGRAYIVFTDFPLAFVKNQPPGALRITFEVLMEGTPLTGLRKIYEFGPDAVGAGGSNNLLMPVTEGVLRILQQPPDTYVHVGDLNGLPLTTDVKTEKEQEWPTGGTDGFADGTVAVTRLYDGAAVRAYGTNGAIAINHASQRLYTLTLDGGTIDILPLLPDQTARMVSVIASADERHLFVFTDDSAGSGTADTYYQLEWDGIDWTIVRTGPVSNGVQVQRAQGPSSQGFFYAGMAEKDLVHIWFVVTFGIPGFSVFEIADDDSMDLAFPHLGDTPISLGAATATMWADNGVCYVIAGEYYLVATRNDGPATNGQSLQQVFEAECSLARLEDAHVDASALAGITVDGMFIRRLGATRGVIQALEPSYFFDTKESGGQLVPVLRGGASVVTITDDELGASLGGQAEEDLINPERADEDSLPGEVIVTYIDRASDYQVAAQHDRRSAVETDQPVNLEMPLVFTPDAARQIASVWMYNQWAGRTKRTIRVSRKYSDLEPTDVITLRTDVADFVVRIVAVKTNDGFIELECVDEDAALYTQNAEGAPVNQGSELQATTPTKLVLLDIPMLRETDNDPGFYVAAAGFGDTWPGGLVLRSTDSGVTYSTVASIGTAATIGFVPLALGNFVGPMGYDAANVITVNLLGNQTLQSVTDAQLLGGANAFALGSTTAGYEIGQFKTAALVSGKTWTLTQLLRGRRGTEHEMAGHGTFETFVLLEASKLKRIAISSPATGLENHYKGVTFGQLASLATAIPFTNTSAGLKPYSPVNAQATGFGGDITITWTRRGRLYNDWRDGVELPLGEASESYSIDIYAGASVVRTLTSSTPTVTYTAAQQATDFGSPAPSSVSVRIYQLSVIVGRGFPFIGTLS